MAVLRNKKGFTRKRDWVQKNYLTSYEHEVAGKVRKYYSITDQGRKYLKSKLDEWETYSVAVANVLAPTGI
jgi:DNA-binding PadR family transcriptional regulator